MRIRDSRDLSWYDAFWAKVDVQRPNDCWLWKASRYKDDYGMVGWRNQGRQGTMRAHALALVMATGEDQCGRLALHRCDNPPCCNPGHLYWGDQRRNIADMDARGRRVLTFSRGEDNPNARLSRVDVEHIRAAYATGMVRQQDLADHYGIRQASVSNILRGLTWK